MVITTSFFTSGVLLTGLLILRHFEVKRGVRFLESKRDQLDNNSRFFYKYITITLPHIVVDIAHTVALHITHVSSSILLIGVRMVERKLHSFVNIVNGRKEVHLREPSSFVKDVSRHKEEVSKGWDEVT